MLEKKLTNSDFISTYKAKPTDFTRKRSFTFKSLSLFIISSLQSSIQRELDRFFRSYNGKEVNEQFATQSAFSQARLKINPDAFVELNNDCVDHFYSNYSIKKWKGFRLIAIDGSQAILPKTRQTIDEFGEYTSNRMNKTIVLARISKAYDVLNKVSIDAKLVNLEIGEHALANQHLEFCSNGDLILLDRGYPSFDLFKNIRATGSHFCARVAVANWNIAKQLVESGEKEIIAEIIPGNDLKRKYKNQNIEVEPVKCRFVCVTLSSGEKEVLITSLLDNELYKHSIFKKLYQLRWDIEESFKKDKHRLQLENFSGKTIVAIYQDFYANILIGNITSILSFSLDNQIYRKTNKTKYKYQINITTSLAKVKEVLAVLFTKSDIIRVLGKLIQLFLSNILPIRPNRSFERDKHKKRKRYHRTYLPL